MFQAFTRETLDHESWSKLANDSLFSQPEWLSLWETLGASPLFFLSSATDTRNPKQAFSCLRFGSRLWSRVQANVDGLTARLLSAANEEGRIEDGLRDDILRALKQSGRTYATWVDYQKRMSPEELPQGWRVHWIETHRLTLTNEPSALSASTLRHIKSGQGRGALVSEIKEASQVERCYELMQETYQNFGRSRMYPLEFYRRLFDYSRAERRIRWYICQVDGEIVGSLIALIEGNEALSWQPFIDRESSEYKPAYLMLSRLIEDARESSLGSVNLGASPVGAEGLISFKERFGARIYRYPVFVYQAAWYRLYSSFRKSESHQ